MISSLILPVIDRTLSLLRYPTSPEWTNPLLSMVYFVFFSSLKYPMKLFRPRRQISPLPSASGLAIEMEIPSRQTPPSFRDSVEVKFLRLDGLVRV